MYNDDREKKSKKISSISSTNDSLKNRSKVENYIRSLLLEQGYTEVRTPIINRYADIAPITQFKVQSPIEQAELYLRVDPTEQLKKLIYYGLDKVFEFSTNFRNDSIDSKHLFEFTSLEIMDKDNSVFDKMNQVEYILKSSMEYCKKEMPESFSKKFCNTDNKVWPHIDIIKYLLTEHSIDIFKESCILKLKQLYEDLYNSNCPYNNKNELIASIVDYLGLKTEVPIFIGNFPWEMEGPAKLGNDNTGKERYELYYKGIEIANMSSTLVNYNQLMEWYFETLGKKNEFEGKEYNIDPELLYIFENNMPKSAVVGIGIDRLIMLLLNKEKISDVVCFDNKEKVKTRKIGGTYGKNKTK